MKAGKAEQRRAGGGYWTNFWCNIFLKWVFWLILAASFLILNRLSFWSPRTQQPQVAPRAVTDSLHNIRILGGAAGESKLLNGAGIILPSYIGVLISREIRIPRKNIQDFMECEPRVCFTLHIFPSTYPSVLKHLGVSCLRMSSLSRNLRSI